MDENIILWLKNKKKKKKKKQKPVNNITREQKQLFHSFKNDQSSIQLTYPN